MIALPLVNQSTTTLLADRKSPPAPEPTEPAFNRSLKEADSRLDQSKPVDQSSGSTENVSERDAPKRTETDRHRRPIA